MTSDAQFLLKLAWNFGIQGAAYARLRRIAARLERLDAAPHTESGGLPTSNPKPLATRAKKRRRK